MVDVITKPLDIDALVATVLRYLGRDAEAPPVVPAEKVGGSGTALAAALDWPQLEQRYAARPERLARMLELARASQSDGPARIRAAAAALDLPQLAELAHTLKGMASLLLASDVVAIARALEIAARAGSSEAAGLAETLASALEAMLEEIANHTI